MRRGFGYKIALILLIPIFLSVLALALLECRLMPLITVGAKSRAKLYASGLLSEAVESSLDPEARLTEIIYDAGEVKAIETNVYALSSLRTSSVKRAISELSDLERMSLRIPIGNLLGNSLFTGRGFELEIKLVPVGDISAELYSEFIETGINQTLHRIYLRMRTTMNMLVITESVRLELSNDILVSETVIVGKVPDAYTAINRFEIDENEENDLNDYAATLP